MIKVLIVEDEKPIANLIRLSLNKEGYACQNHGNHRRLDLVLEDQNKKQDAGNDEE